MLLPLSTVTKNGCLTQKQLHISFRVGPKGPGNFQVVMHRPPRRKCQGPAPIGIAGILAPGPEAHCASPGTWPPTLALEPRGHRCASPRSLPLGSLMSPNQSLPGGRWEQRHR